MSVPFIEEDLRALRLPTMLQNLQSYKRLAQGDDIASRIWVNYPAWEYGVKSSDLLIGDKVMSCRKRIARRWCVEERFNFVRHATQ